METSIGLLEFNSIAKGIEATDAMLKAGMVDLLFSRPICPGKYASMVNGEVAAVRSAVDAGVIIAEETLVDKLIIPNVHPSVIKAIASSSEVKFAQALGIIETFTIASLIVSADLAVKAANVELMEIRLAVGLGGKAYCTLTGEVSAVESAVETGAKYASDEGMLIKKVVIPSPREELIKMLL